MKKLTYKDAILCVSIEEAIAIRDKFNIDIKKQILKQSLKDHIEICLYQDNCFSGKTYAKYNGFKITKASKILNSKKELLQRIEKLEKVMIDNTEVTVSKMEITEALKDARENTAKSINRDMEALEEEKTLSIREVQVKVNSQEEANECAKIAKDCGEKIWGYESALKFNYDEELYFQKNDADDDFFIGIKEESLKEISIQEFRERFGKPKEIDWSKAGQYVTNGFIVVMTMEESNKTNEGNFRGVCIHKEIEKEWEDEVGQYSNNWIRPNFKLCTEPITLSN